MRKISSLLASIDGKPWDCGLGIVAFSGVVSIQSSALSERWSPNLAVMSSWLKKILCGGMNAGAAFCFFLKGHIISRAFLILANFRADPREDKQELHFVFRLRWPLISLFAARPASRPDTAPVRGICARDCTSSSRLDSRVSYPFSARWFAEVGAVFPSSLAAGPDWSHRTFRARSRPARWSGEKP